MYECMRGRPSRPLHRDLVVYCALNRILERYDGVVWIGLIWLRIGTSGELL
jgi:hypothetical protein